MFQVSGFKFQVSSFKFQVSGCKSQWLAQRGFECWKVSSFRVQGPVDRVELICALDNNGFNSQFSILNSQFSILNSQFSILNSQFSILNSQFSILNSQFSILNFQFSILNSQFSILSSPPEGEVVYCNIQPYGMMGGKGLISPKVHFIIMECI